MGGFFYFFIDCLIFTPRFTIFRHIVVDIHFQKDLSWVSFLLQERILFSHGRWFCFIDLPLQDRIETLIERWSQNQSLLSHLCWSNLYCRIYQWPDLSSKTCPSSKALSIDCLEHFIMSKRASLCLMRNTIPMCLLDDSYHYVCLIVSFIFDYVAHLVGSFVLSLILPAASTPASESVADFIDCSMTLFFEVI